MEVGRHAEEEGPGGCQGDKRPESRTFAPVCPHELRTVGPQGRHPGPVPSGTQTVKDFSAWLLTGGGLWLLNGTLTDR